MSSYLRSSITATETASFTVTSNNKPFTSVARVSNGILLSGDQLMLFNSVTMTTIRVTTTYAATNFKYVICIDSSTCIAADDSTSAFNYYQMTSSNFLGTTDSVTLTTIASISSSVATTGLATLPTQTTMYIGRETYVYVLTIGSNAPTQIIYVLAPVIDLKLALTTIGGSNPLLSVATSTILLL